LKEKSPDYTLLLKSIDDAIDSYRARILGKVWSHCKLDDFDIKTLNGIFMSQVSELENFFLECDMKLIKGFNAYNMGWEILYTKFKLSDSDKAQHMLLRN
jgi:hypothetical protein